MSTRVLKATVVAFVILAVASVATAAQASMWTVASSFAAKPALAQAEPAPAAPTGLTLDCPSPTQKVLRVAWNAVPHAATYDLLYSTSATGPFVSTGAAIAGTSWTSGTLANASYWVQVSATVSANWKSPLSAIVGPRVIKGGSVNCS